MNVLTQNRELIRWPLGHNEALAAQADKQRKRAVTDPLRSLIRALARELAQRLPQVFEFPHAGNAEAIA